MITLAELGPTGLRRTLDAADTDELQQYGQRPPSLSYIGRGPEVGAQEWGGRISRKTDATNRLLIDQEQHVEQIVAQIWRCYETLESKRLISKYASTENNLLKRTVDRLAVAYEKPPVRRYASKALSKRMREAVIDEGKLDVAAEQWARYAFLLNVVHVIPQVIDGRLSFETILPHSADVVIDDGDHDPSILTYLARGRDYSRVAVDAHQFWYLNKNGEIVDSFRHGYLDLQGRPMAPWIQWRVRGRVGGTDYWQRAEGRRMVDATLKVGRIGAHQEYVRQNNASKLMTLTADSIDTDIPANQRLAPETPTMLRGNAVLDVHDLVVSPEGFIADKAEAAASLADAYGVPHHVIGNAGDRSQVDPEAQAAVSKQRNSQVKHLARAEVETLTKAAIIMRADGHRLGRRINPAQVAKVHVRFPPLTYVDEPGKKWDAAVQELSLGQTDHIALAMREDPSLDEAEAEAKVRTSIERRNEFSALLSAHNLPADAGQDGDTVAMLQGRLGGMSTPEPDGDGDGREQQRSAAG